MPEMAGENARRMKEAYEALERGDTEVVFDLIDPDVEISDRPEIPDPQTYRGHEGVVEALGRNVETFETLDFIPERFVEVGDKIVAVLLMRGRGRGSGVPVEDRIAHLWTLRDGRAYRLQVYSDPEEAIAVAREGSVEFVRRIYEAWQAGEVDRVNEFLDPAVEWVEPAEAPESNTWHGPDGALSSTEQWTSAWSEYEIELVQLVPSRDRVLVHARQRGRGRESGVVVESDIFHVWTIREGRAVRMEMYFDKRLALDSAGLAPDGSER